MATDSISPFPRLEDLAPPPRRVPLWLWCSLLARPLTPRASGVFAFALVFGLIFVPAASPIGGWRLDLHQERGQGWLEGVTQTNFHEGEDGNGTTIYRCDYTFALPDGTQVKGASYTLGEQFHLPPAVPG